MGRRERFRRRNVSQPKGIGQKVGVAVRSAVMGCEQTLPCSLALGQTRSGHGARFRNETEINQQLSVFRGANGGRRGRPWRALVG